MRFFKKTSIDFMGKRKLWYTVSALVILSGMVSLFVKGINFGIDFKGGTELVVQFAREVEIGDIRSAMDKVGFNKAEIKTFGSNRDILIRTPEQGAGAEIADKIRGGLSSSFPDNPFKVQKEDKIGPKIGAELRRDAVYAVLASLVAILLYLLYRGEKDTGSRQSRVAREVFANALGGLGVASGAPGHKTESLYESGKRLAAASKMTDAQLNLLSGVLRKATLTIDSLQERDSKT